MYQHMSQILCLVISSQDQSFNNSIAKIMKKDQSRIEMIENRVKSTEF